MHEEESRLEKLLQDFSKLPGHDRRKITRHLSGRDKLLVKKLISQRSEDLETIEVKDKVDLANSAVQDAQLDLSSYSSWLHEKLEEILNGDGSHLEYPVTDTSKKVILHFLKNQQAEIQNKNSVSADLKRSISNPFQKWGKRNGG